MLVDLVPPSSSSLREAISHLRYAIYVEEMDRDQPGTCHSTQRIVDPQDQSGRLFAAFDGDRLIGTVRNDYVRDGDNDEYVALYGARAYVEQRGRERVSISGRLMVLPEYRSRRAAFALAAATYARALEDGIHHNLIDCNPPVEPFFRRLGYRIFRRPVKHPSYGPVAVLVLDLFDREHLARVRSPFLRLLDEFLAKARSRTHGGLRHVVS